GGGEPAGAAGDREGGRVGRAAGEADDALQGQAAAGHHRGHHAVLQQLAGRLASGPGDDAGPGVPPDDRVVPVALTGGGELVINHLHVTGGRRARVGGADVERVVGEGGSGAGGRPLGGGHGRQPAARDHGRARGDGGG